MATLGLNSNYGNYRRLEKSIAQGAIGRQAQTERGVQSRLASMGMADSPGVSADLTSRSNVKTMGVLADSRAKLGIQAAQDTESKRRFDEQMQFKRDQVHNQQKAAKRQLWIQGISALIGAAGEPIGAMIAAGGQVAAAKIEKGE